MRRPYAYRGEVALADVRDGEYRRIRTNVSVVAMRRANRVSRSKRSERSSAAETRNEFAESMRRSDERVGERVGERVATRSIALDRLTVTRFTRLLRA